MWSHTGFGRNRINFFTAVCLILHFTFLIRTVLITRWQFSYFWEVLTNHLFFLFLALAPVSNLEEDKSRRHQNWDSWSKLIKRSMLCHAFQQNWRAELARDCHYSRTSRALVRPVNNYFCNICLNLLCFTGILLLLLLFSFALVFSYLINHLYINPWIFSLLLFQFYPTLYWGKEWVFM